MDADVDLQTKSYTKSYELAWLSFSIDIYSGYFEDNKMQVIPLEKNKFYRDSFLIKSTANDSWSIRIGDTGRTFNGTFEEFCRNVLETNSNSENSGNDRVEIFRYFDPMYPQECEVLGYASDYFRTMFFLNDGRIYYIDAVIDN